MFGLGGTEVGILAVLAVPGIVGATIAGRRGRLRFSWFILSTVFPFAILILLFLPPTRPVKGRYKTCAFCAEIIRHQATVCKHCGRDQPAI